MTTDPASPAPTLRLRVVNPKTGTNTGTGYTLANEAHVAAEIDALAGVEGGFIELINGKGRILEILSPGPTAFLVIPGRAQSKAEIVDRASVMRQLGVFAKG